MKIFQIAFFLLYLAPFSYVLFKNPSLELTFIFISISFAFFIGKYALRNISKSGSLYMFPKYVLESLLILSFIFQFERIYQGFISIFKGELIEFGLELAMSRYYENSGLTLGMRIGGILFFCASLIMGLSISRKTNKKTIFAYIILLLSTLFDFGRTSFLINSSFLISGILVRYSHNISKLSLKRTLTTLILAALFALLFYALPQYGRVASKENALEIITNKFSAYSYDMYFAFSEYLKDYKNNTSDGSQTIGLVSSIIGETKTQGMYERIYTPNGATNLFTIFRGIIDDFGFYTFPIIIMVFYLASIMSFIVKNKIHFILCFSALPMLLYPFYSIYYFNNVLIGYFLFSIILYKSKRVDI